MNIRIDVDDIRRNTQSDVIVIVNTTITARVRMSIHEQFDDIWYAVRHEVYDNVYIEVEERFSL